MQSDGALVVEALRGDCGAFAALVACYERAARTVALQVLRDHHKAEDAVQEAFVIAYERLGRLRSGASFGAWVLRIVRHEAVRLLRQKGETVSLRAESIAAPDRNDGSLDEELLDAVARLPKHERTVVSLRYADGHSVHEIAAITGRPVGTVTKQLSRAHKRLRQWLKEQAS